MRKSKKVLALALAAIMAVSAFAGCGGETDVNETTTANGGEQQSSQDATTTTAPAAELSIMLPYGDHANDELDLTIEFRNKLESYTNTKITWELYDSVSYYEKLTLKYASGELTTIMVTDKNADFLSACKYNTFWDITDYLDLYDNFAAIPDAVRMNASNNGKLYGVPRSRNLGRNAFAFRQDWADNLGLGFPETVDDVYEMAVAFTNNDPDGNGKNDTWGFALDTWQGQWDMMFPWFGVHNVWGFDEEGKLEYYATQEEFKTALKTFRQWNSEGLFGDWMSFAPGDTDKKILRVNLAGISVQVADNPRRAQVAMNGTADAPGTYPEAKFTYFGSVEGANGYWVLPTDGFSGYVAVTKALAPTEDDLMSALQFLNDINDAEMRNLIDFGLEGKDYYMENGYAVRYDETAKTEMGVSNAAYREGYNQMVAYFSNAEETAKLIGLDPSLNSDIVNAEAAIKLENEQYTIANYGSSYTSATYESVGADLDAHIETLIQEFILGNIDETALDAGIEQWYEMGGQAYIDEMNAAYEAANAN